LKVCWKDTFGNNKKYIKHDKLETVAINDALPLKGAMTWQNQK